MYYILTIYLKIVLFSYNNNNKKINKIFVCCFNFADFYIIRFDFNTFRYIFVLKPIRLYFVACETYFWIIFHPLVVSSRTLRLSICLKACAQIIDLKINLYTIHLIMQESYRICYPKIILHSNVLHKYTFMRILFLFFFTNRFDNINFIGILCEKARSKYTTTSNIYTIFDRFL